MADDHLLARLRGVAGSLDEAAPPIGASDPLPAGVRGPDRRPLLALVAMFVVVAGGLALLLVDRDGDDGSVVTPGPGPTSTSTSTTLDFDVVPDAGFAIRRGEGVFTLYDFGGVEVGVMPLVDGTDPNLPPALVATPMSDLDVRIEDAEVPEGCAAAAAGGAVRVALCGLVEGRYRRIDVIGDDGTPTVLSEAPPDPGAPIVIGAWNWASVSPDGRWVLAEWGAECGSQTAFVLSTDGTGPIRTVTGEPADTWLDAIQSRALGWAADGRALFEIPTMDCGGPLDEAGVYALDPATGERELLRAAAGDDEVAYSWIKQYGYFNGPERLLARALSSAGLESCCGEPAHGSRFVTSGAVFEGHDLSIRGGPADDEFAPNPIGGQRLPLRSGEALVAERVVYFTCGPNTWEIGWNEDGTPEIDSMLLLAEELVPRLACTLRPPPTAG